MNFVSDGKDKGSTFSFVLPLHASTSDGIDLTYPASAVESNTMEVICIYPTDYGDLEAGIHTGREIQTLPSTLQSNLQQPRSSTTAFSHRKYEPILTPRGHQDDVVVETMDESPQHEHKATTPRGSRSPFRSPNNVNDILTADDSCHLLVLFRIAQIHQNSSDFSFLEWR